MTLQPLVRGEDVTSLGLLGSHPSMIELCTAIRRAAQLDAPVVVWGPTGSGKELVVRALHQLSPLREGPLCAVNIAALPETLVESELFGAARGAFTGAVAARPGLIEAARGGSLFLDEAGDLPPAVQPKLLRVLEDGEVRRVGTTKAAPVAFRLLVAVQEDPAGLRRSGRWRDDLYYRITAVILRVPPLSERRSDIPALAAIFLRQRGLSGIEAEALRVLVGCDWPGNVRELQQTLLRAAFYADGDLIRSEHVRQALGAATDASSLRLDVARVAHVRTVLAACGGNTGDAASLLGISRRHVNRLLKQAPRGDGPCGTWMSPRTAPGT